MEIGPVAAVRIVAAVRPRDAGLGLPGVFQAEFTARTGDETYSPAVARSAGGAEEDDLYDLEDDPDAEPRVRTLPGGPRRQVNYFA